MIHRERRGVTEILRLEHGKVQALDIELLQELDAALVAAEGGDAGAVVVTGTGGSFSAGVDLPRVVREGAPYVARFLPLLDAVLARWFHLKKPVVAALNGHAIAGGCVFAACSDRRILAKGALVGVPELAVGVPFPPLVIEILRYAIPAPHLQQAVLGAKNYDAETALRLGLVDEVVEREQVLSRALAAAEDFAALPAGPFAAAKRALRRGVADRRDLDEEAASFAPLWTTPETIARISAYLDRIVRKAGVPK
jgi:enoyl-CoA hydratase